MSVISIAIALVVGVVVGLITARLMGNSPVGEDQLRQELDQAKMELEQYKEDIRDHFEQSAEMMKQLARDYDKLARHVNDGANTLLSLDSDAFSLTNDQDEPEQEPTELLAEPPRDYSQERHGLLNK